MLFIFRLGEAFIREPEDVWDRMFKSYYLVLFHTQSFRCTHLSNRVIHLYFPRIRLPQEQSFQTNFIKHIELPEQKE